MEITGSVAVEHGRKALEVARHHFGTHDVTAEQVVEVFPETIAEDPLHEWWQAEVVGEAAQISFLVISEEYQKAHPDVTYPLIEQGSGHGSGHGSEHGLSLDESVVKAGRVKSSSESTTSTTVAGDPLDEVLNGGTLPPVTTTSTTDAPTTTAPAHEKSTTEHSSEDSGHVGGLPSNAFRVAVAACVRVLSNEMRVREGACPAAEVAHDGHGAHGSAHWTYEGDAGQTHWGSLSEEYSTCGTGAEQSPIDIKAPVLGQFEPPAVNYTATEGTASDNGHTLKVSFELGSSIKLNERLYRLVELHYHATSEHTLEGTSYPAELHFVHKTVDDKIAVIGVLLEAASEPNTTWASVINALAAAPKTGSASVGKLQLQQIMPQEPEVYRYEGSLTTPPCSEGVKWSVMTQPVKVSAKQIAKLTKRYAANSRAVQPLNERDILVLPTK
jgi:carbonic anhydrase